MSNLPIAYSNNAPLSADLEQQLREQFDESFAQLGGGTFRTIRPRKMDFLLRDGQTETVVPADKMFGVLLRASPVNHAVWYERKYAPGQEPARPDLVWKMPTATTFHPALPEKFHSKQLVDGHESWAFQIVRRTVWALLRVDPQGQAYLDLESPYVLDVSSMSMFGAGVPAQHFYKFAGLRTFCTQQGAGRVITPSMFITQLLLDPTVSVTGVMLFRPQLNPDGSLVLLDTPLIQAILQRASSPEVVDLCDVKEQDNYSNRGSAAPTQAPAAVPTPAAAPAPTAMPTPVAAPAPVQTASAVASPTPTQPATSDTAHLLEQAQQLFNPAPAAAPVAASPEPAKADTPASAVNDMLARLQA